jgi:hypothetical protein
VSFATFAVKYLILLQIRTKLFNRKGRKVHRKERKKTRNRPIANYLHLKNVAFAGYELVQHGIHKEADEEPGDQPGYDGLPN